MKQFVIISYEGRPASRTEVLDASRQFCGAISSATSVHVSTMTETEVNAIVVQHSENENTRELSVVESACIYVKEKFGKFFNSKLKLMLALSEAVNNEPNNESLTNAIKIMSCGVSKRMRDSYGISTDVICVFKMVQDNM